MFGFVSHLPHTVAYALVNSVASSKGAENIIDYAGGGLNDFTRIAASSPEMWSDIFLMNRESLLLAITEFKKSLDDIELAIENGEYDTLRENLDRAATITKSTM